MALRFGPLRSFTSLSPSLRNGADRLPAGIQARSLERHSNKWLDSPVAQIQDRGYKVFTFKDSRTLVSPGNAILNTLLPWLSDLQAYRIVILGTSS
jgi:hypothetical protein